MTNKDEVHLISQKSKSKMLTIASMGLFENSVLTRVEYQAQDQI